MKEYIKLFDDLNSADEYVITDIPFTTTVKRDEVNLSPQNLVCNSEDKRIDVIENVAVIVDNIRNTKYYFNNETMLEITSTTISRVSSYASTLVRAEIGNIVTTISNGAFTKHTLLTDVIISDSVTSLGANVFDDCEALTSVTLGTGITSIPNRVFEYCSALPNLVIPDTVTSIGEYTFSDCTSLTSLTIGGGMSSFGSYAFRNCTSLSTINYNGTISQWNSINKGFEWNKNVPSTAIIHCSDGNINIQ